MLGRELSHLKLRKPVFYSACKKQNVIFFNQRLIRKFCPRRFDNFAYAPSIGASRGILILWSSIVFSRTLMLKVLELFCLSHPHAIHTDGPWLCMGLVTGPLEVILCIRYITCKYLLMIIGC